MVTLQVDLDALQHQVKERNMLNGLESQRNDAFGKYQYIFVSVACPRGIAHRTDLPASQFHICSQVHIVMFN